MSTFAVLPSLQELCLNLPVYAPVSLENITPADRTEYVNGLSNPENPIEGFCVECQKDRILHGHQINSFINSAGRHSDSVSNLFIIEFRCAKDSQHKSYFVFLHDEHRLTKIGQSPSISDLRQSEIKPYRKILSNERYKDLNRAIALAAHDVGVGSFIYLRRVFEFLIEKAYRLARTASGWDDEKFHRARMDEKVIILRDHLPTFLVENRALYGILSKGVHDLTEEECLAHFHVVRISVELILDQELELLKKNEKILQAQKSIIATQQAIKK